MLKVLKRIEGRGIHETAHRTRQRCSQVFRYAVQTGRASHDVTADLRGALAPVVSEHHAAITEPARIGELLRAFDGYTGHTVRGKHDCSRPDRNQSEDHAWKAGHPRDENSCGINRSKDG